MIGKLIALSLVFGVVVAEPISRITFPIDDTQLSSKQEDTSENQLARIVPEKVVLLLDIVNAMIGYKVSAVSLAVSAIEWLVANGVFVAIGAIICFGFCKLTGKCSVNYEEYLPVAQLRSMVTPEYLESAENIFLTAMEKYAQKQRGRSQNSRIRY